MNNIYLHRIYVMNIHNHKCCKWVWENDLITPLPKINCPYTMRAKWLIRKSIAPSPKMCLFISIFKPDLEPSTISVSLDFRKCVKIFIFFKAQIYRDTHCFFKLKSRDTYVSRFSQVYLDLRF